MFVTDNVRCYYQSKQKVLSSNTFGRMQTLNKKNKMENLINDNLDPGSSNESETESENETDNESVNDQSNEKFLDS